MEMVLGYLRTEDMASDIRFEEMDMDSLIREQIHKFARIFIGKKLSLEYQEVSETVQMKNGLALCWDKFYQMH